MNKFNDWLFENTKEKPMEVFAQKRHDGAEKIANTAHEKGGVALLTYNHFHVKLPYYKKAVENKMNYKTAKSEYEKLCNELHSHMKNIEKMDQTHFQKLVGKIEVLGELLIKKENNE